MTITDEPGIYEEGKLGIRIENELLCVSVCETEYGRFYGFEPFTYCSIDTRPLVLSLMDEELRWLNGYHAMVKAELEAFLTPEENAWLAEAARLWKVNAHSRSFCCCGAGRCGRSPGRKVGRGPGVLQRACRHGAAVPFHGRHSSVAVSALSGMAGRGGGRCCLTRCPAGLLAPDMGGWAVA